MDLRRFVSGGAALALLALSAGALAAELDVVTAERIAGSDAATGITFSAEVSGDTVVAEVRLPDTKQLTATLDYAASRLTLKTSRTDYGVPLALLREETLALKDLARDFPQPAGRLGDALASFVSLLAEAPVGATLDREPPKVSKAEMSKSLCERVGTERIAHWDTDGRSHGKKVLLGPCYNKDNGCMGRCGKGCSANVVAGEGNPTAVQRFTQACLNHDMCNEKTGDVLGDCTDEFFAAADDFFFARDCAALDGKWVDGNGLTWKLNQNQDLQISGHVEVPSCGRYTVEGHHSPGKNYVLKAKTKDVAEGCCGRIVYEGKLSSCDASTFKAKSGCDFIESSTLDRKDPWQENATAAAD
jgi:hypothetical protein